MATSRKSSIKSGGGSRSYKAFDPVKAGVPDHMCPIATDLIVMNTGEWRSERPVVARAKCVKCGTCWAFCPTQCIVEKPLWFEADMVICKGCGICAVECPHGAITMVTERE
ncbi:MAG: 4Fe-4S binding protein [Syntrophales bacterium]|jgi:2-oxoacid:acceptor oxidoreductase delta subunit (pyruvate/2-ketoisovalerate family)|nr:4Fe-4S binding protein [Syntrophales bacterium]